METRPPAMLVGDALALDFLNSIATPVDSPVDWLGDGAAFIGWMAEANVVPRQTLDNVQAEAMPGELDKVADQARALREWFRGFVMKHKGHPLTARDLGRLEPLNRLLARDESFAQIVAPTRTGQLELTTMRRWRSPEALLLPIGGAMAQLVCEEDFTNVKACEGASCTLLFADRTRGHARRWCSMAICGNRAKQAAHRLRARDDR